MMDIEEWLDLNPNHKVVISKFGARRCATLKGGEGVDINIRGYGDSAAAAMQCALDLRERIKSTLP